MFFSFIENCGSMAVSGTLDPENLDNDIDGKAGGAA
jgi:hypothetical protein